MSAGNPYVQTNALLTMMGQVSEPIVNTMRAMKQSPLDWHRLTRSQAEMQPAIDAGFVERRAMGLSIRYRLTPRGFRVLGEK